MSRLIALTAPTLLLCLGSLGTGLLCLAATRLRARLPSWLYASIAFVLGQGVLGSVFELVALAGGFTRPVVLALVVVPALVAIALAGRHRSEVRGDLMRVRRAWRGAGVVWKCVAGAAALFVLYGFTSVGGMLIVDAPAFYMAIAKMVGGTGRLVTLPGYDPFSSVGLLAELHMAALYALGQRGTDPRILPWASFLPAVALVYGLARLCGLARRGAVLTILMVLTSTAVIFLWGSGKTDLLALGPALGACILVLVWWDRPADPAPLAVAGLLTGFASVMKLSYVVAFLPVLAILVVWRAAAEIVEPHTATVRDGLRMLLRAAALLAAGFAIAFAPHLLKNWVLFHVPFSPMGIEPFFSRSTTTRLLLTYPFALTYGRYWGQVGTISPLVLAYAPLAMYFAPTVHWTANRILAISAAAVAGMAAWMILCPSIFAPRYILVTPLLFALPAAAAAERLSRFHALLSFLVVPIVVVVLVATPQHANVYGPVLDDVRTSLARIMAPENPCAGSYPYENDCAAHESINARAFRNDRVLVLSYVRLWLRPDLLRSASNSTEVDRYLACHKTGCDAAEFWKLLTEDGRFRFILHDRTTHAVPPGVFDAAPPGVHIVRLFSGPNIDAYKVAYGPN